MTKKRISITAPKHLDCVLEKLARRDHMSQATKVAELLRLAVEIEEDQMWDTLASRRDVQNTDFSSHKKAWQ